MAKVDPQVLAHLEWLGFVRPTGLVVSAPALVRAGAILDRRDAEGQRLLRARTVERTFDPKEGPVPWSPDFRAFATAVLGWSFSARWYAGTTECPVPPDLYVSVAGHDETIRPDFAVREPDAQNGGPAWQLLVQLLEPGEDFDRVVRRGSGLEASANQRMERLLRQTGALAGLLFNGCALRLVSAPRGESSGWLDFRVADMVQTAGRPISTALRLLLGEQRLLGLPRPQRLAALLSDSRKFQNEVSERLAEQVLHALYELLRGFQAAHDASKGVLLREPLGEHPDEVYRALLTVILRLVFLLYAEERDMLPEDEAFLRYYSIAGLHERLREDAALYPDTMDQRFAAWPQLLVLFRMVHDGAESGSMRLPRRHGVLFDPDRFPFLEGRQLAGGRQLHERVEPPLVPDGTIYRALEKLLVLDGERISYRALDVEEIGSVYQAMMGFKLVEATGQSVAVKAQKKWAAPATVDLEALLAVKPAARKRWLEETTDRKLTETVAGPVKAARTVEDLHAGLSPVVDREATPDLVPQGAMVLQPSDERRRSGSHYTPRTLTKPIVETTLEPILARLRGPDGQSPRPEQILELKLCDPAMGSGAFLVEACRQLGDALVEAWRAKGGLPSIPPDEDELVYARRLVAQRCLYGVDRNTVAVDLAKVSLWLATLAKDHPLTFVDHALRHGDSLVGLSRAQLSAFHWDASAPAFQAGFESARGREHLAKVSALRAKIRDAGENVSDRELRDLWHEVQVETSSARLLGDLVVAAFFDGLNDREREAKRAEYGNAVAVGKTADFSGKVEERRRSDPPLVPFHWHLEFPEVFERERPGFDAFVGNPPFLGGKRISTTLGEAYRDWLSSIHVDSSSNADLVAHFYRRAFSFTRDGGTLGLIATNTIAQGDTRSSGLRWIAMNGGEIFAANRRVRWPGLAAVVVSVVHIMKGSSPGPKRLDGRDVEKITAFLFHRGGSDDPGLLVANAGRSFVGNYVLGMGFTFDDTDGSGVASPIAEMRRLIAMDSRNAEVIRPYIGGEEVNNSPTHANHRFVINFGNRTEQECRSRWPDLLAIVEAKVKPERMKVRRAALSERWWQFAEKQPALQRAVGGLNRVMVTCRHQPQWCATFMDATNVFAESLVVFPTETYEFFCTVQSRVHEIWARFLGSSMKDDLRYTPSDCLGTFPLPDSRKSGAGLELSGKAYFEFRAGVMVRSGEGLTKTYNRFHDPDEREAGILKLRELHAAMDRAVLDAYGWSDINTDCQFLLDYEIDEEEQGDKKKPWRYRWPDEVREEVLARLLELNAERAKEEARAGSGGRPTGGTSPTSAGGSRKKGAKGKAKDTKTGDLF
jgi:Eco57I restriction-modification methylase/restriction-modification enzyme MmeI-like protein